MGISMGAVSSEFGVVLRTQMNPQALNYPQIIKDLTSWHV